MLEFARRLSELRKPVWIGYVLVQGLTDDSAELDNIADFISGDAIERIEVLPFHQLGRVKWEQLGLRYDLQDARPPSQPEIDEAIARFRTRGLHAL